MLKGFDEGVSLKYGQKSPLHCLVEEIKQPGICTPAHYHKYIEILYGIDCDINVYTGDTPEKFCTGDICFISPGETHFMYSEKPYNKYYVIKFSQEMLYYDGQMISEIRCLLPLLYTLKLRRHLIGSGELEGENVEPVFADIYKEWLGDEIGYEFAIRGQILKLLSVIIRKYGNHEALSAENDVNIKTILETAEYINKNFDTVTEKEMAERCHMSYSHFSRLFKKIMGRCFAQFVNDARIEEAKRLLVTTSSSITDISIRTGFSTSSHFIATFKKSTGMTPVQFKKYFDK